MKNLTIKVNEDYFRLQTIWLFYTKISKAIKLLNAKFVVIIVDELKSAMKLTRGNR